MKSCPPERGLSPASLFLKIIPPKWAAIDLVLGMTLHFVWLKAGGGRLALPRFGILSLTLGFAVMVWAWRLFHLKETAVHPFEESTYFVQEGPYRFTRNPMYLGMTLILLGIALFAGTPPAFFTPLAFFLTMNAAFVPFEEKKMAARFGEAYLAYKRRVRRWF